MEGKIGNEAKILTKNQITGRKKCIVNKKDISSITKIKSKISNHFKGWVNLKAAPVTLRIKLLAPQNKLIFIEIKTIKLWVGIGEARISDSNIAFSNICTRFILPNKNILIAIWCYKKIWGKLRRLSLKD